MGESSQTWRRGVAVAVYIVTGAVWIFWILDRGVFFGSDAAWLAAASLLVLLHLGVGFAAGRWWALGLPFIWVALAYPLGYPSESLGEPPILWQGLLGLTPIAVMMLALGVALSTLGPWRGGLGVR